ncbi:MAG TPA: hypothetical protein VIY73_04600 [Polyangiaceae bacterium]
MEDRDRDRAIEEVLTAREAASVAIALTEQEARSLVRASTLVIDVLRPELFSSTGRATASPLVTACQVLVAACERAGISIAAS